MLLLQEKLEIAKGVTYKHSFYVMDNDGSAINTTGFIVKMHLKQDTNSTKIHDLTPFLDSETYQNSGIVLLDIPHQETHNVPWKSGIYDLIIQDVSDGGVYEVSTGMFSTRQVTTNIEIEPDSVSTSNTVAITTLVNDLVDKRISEILGKV